MELVFEVLEEGVLVRELGGEQLELASPLD